MGKILKFEPKKTPKKKEPSAKEKELAEKKAEKNKIVVRHNKAMNYIAWVNSQYKHKFTYPNLACRYPKDTHSIDVLHGHCFTSFGAIQADMPAFPGIAMAKQWACERQDEIISFINWRLRKYQEAKMYYGDDLIVIDVYVEMFEQTRSRFQELFNSYGRT